MIVAPIGENCSNLELNGYILYNLALKAIFKSKFPELPIASTQLSE